MPGAAANDVVDSIARSWWPLDELVTALPDSAFDLATGSGWTVKEMLAHVAFWVEAVDGFMTLVVRQHPVPGGWRFGSGYVATLDRPWPHFEEHNAREAAWGREQSPAAIRERLHAAHTGLVRFLETVSEDEAAAHASYFHEIAGHLDEHCAELRAVSVK